MVEELNYGKMEPNMKVSGRMVNRMAEEWKHCLMGQYIMVNGVRVLRMELVWRH